MGNATEQLADVVDKITSHSLDYAVLLAAIGALAMALVELAKSLFSLRRRYNEDMIKKWTGDEGPRFDELLLLAAGGAEGSDALFDQPAEKMMGQIQAAANVALDFPDRYPHFYGLLTAEKGLAAPGEDDSARWMDFAQRMARGEIAGMPEEQQRELSRQAQQARARLANLVARRLDARQNALQYRWARLNQAAGVVTGAGLSLYAIASTTSFTHSDDYAAAILLSLLAGLLSPFAKDVVSALSGVKARR